VSCAEETLSSASLHLQELGNCAVSNDAGADKNVQRLLAVSYFSPHKWTARISWTI